jgi:ABC-type multidrug transport system fused ATPase/permease subunit
MNNEKNLKKMWMNSLSFLDNSMINSVIVIVLVLYCSTIFDNINSFVGNLYNFSIIKLIVLLLIIYVAPKDMTIALLLGLSYVISLSYMVNNEYFTESHSKNISEEDIHQKIESHHEYIEQELESHLKNKKSKEYFFPLNNKNVNNRNVNSEDFSKKDKKEHFFPLNNRNVNSEDFSKKDEKEHFFPLQHMNSADFNIKGDKEMNDNVMQEETNFDKSCMQTYTPMFESVGNVCSPTATFKNELNAQGLNFPEGFNSPVQGSPLN